MLRVPWTAKKTNKSIMAHILKYPALENVGLGRKLAYFGHVVRDEGLEKAVMLGMGGGIRSRGRPRRRWLNEVVEVTGLSLQHLKEAAREGNGWKELIHVITKGRDQLDGTI